MGMFDYIVYDGREYQTKSLDCQLERYYLGDKILSKDGKLVNYTGGINFYEFDLAEGWVEYVALIDRGQLVSVRVYEEPRTG
jgi:hypothetical protein